MMEEKSRKRDEDEWMIKKKVERVMVEDGWIAKELEGKVKIQMDKEGVEDEKSYVHGWEEFNLK